MSNVFRSGDLVRNVSEVSRFCGREGTFIGYWCDWHGGVLLTLRNACDVEYPGITGPYGYAYIAQSADKAEPAANYGV